MGFAVENIGAFILTPAGRELRHVVDADINLPYARALLLRLKQTGRPVGVFGPHADDIAAGAS
jgi:hypothetical protein